jgi:hypothetical protein
LQKLRPEYILYRGCCPADPPFIGARPGQGANPYRPLQRYLDEAPLGIEVDEAWRYPGGRGGCAAFVDLETGWAFHHVDLPQTIEPPISGMSKTPFGHGTRTLGVVAALDNDLGVVGIAPELASVRVISIWRTASRYCIADAIASACSVMCPGHVLLLEVQVTDDGQSLPCEVHPPIFDALALASRLGITVIEAAGNGGVTEGIDLDTYSGPNGRVLCPSSSAFKDSWAIMVGGSQPNLQTGRHSRSLRSNFGSRVDCFSWGMGVFTTGGNELDVPFDLNLPLHLVVDDPQPNGVTTYYNDFSGTSSASAIIAGAAVVVQSVAQAMRGRPIAPLELRSLLSDPGLNTPSSNTSDRIGLMPNLKKILAREFGQI